MRVLRGLVASFFAAFPACREATPQALVELPPSPTPLLEERRLRGEFALEGTTEALRFFVGDLEREPSASSRAESVRLADGGLLASKTRGADYEFLTCYLHLKPHGDGWQPVGFGLYHGSCVGFHWLGALRGKVIVDSDASGLIDCRIETTAFRGDLLIDPNENSTGLRNTVQPWSGSPALR